MIERQCEYCGNNFLVKHQSDKKRFCNNSCSAKWRVSKIGPPHRVFSESDREQAREHMSNLWKSPEFRKNNFDRMTNNNPMYNPKSVTKMIESNYANGTYNNNNFNRCGNGKMSDCEKIAYDILIPLGFEYNKPISTKSMRTLYPDKNYPTNYKPDFIYKNVIVEIDGTNHTSPKGKELDAKKEEFFSMLGIHTFRFTNDFVKTQPTEFNKVVKEIMKNEISK